MVFLGNIRGSFTDRGEGLLFHLRRELTIQRHLELAGCPAEIAQRLDDRPLPALATRMEIARLVSHTPRLSEGAEVFRRILARKEFFNKVVFVP